MPFPDSTTEATTVGVGAENIPFQYSGVNQEARVGLFGTYDPAILTLTDNDPIEVLSAADAGNRTGYGFMLHRLAIQAFEGLNGTGRVYIIPQSEAGGAAAAVGNITWVGTPTTKAGTIWLRISGKLYNVAIPSGSTMEEYSDLVVAAVNADADVAVIAATTPSTFVTTFTAKSKGPFGNDISLSLNTETDEALPTGITSGTIIAIGTVTPGTGIPDIDDAYDGTGTGDDKNQIDLTHVVNGYGLDTTTIDKTSLYVGEGNTFDGLYSKVIGRPFVSLNGDVTAGTAGYTALRVITDARLEDRANGYTAVPDSSWHPDEIAALEIGKVAAIFQSNPAESYNSITLGGVDPGLTANRWTKDGNVRDLAVKGGISPTIVVNENVKVQNVITSYRPATIPTASNGFKSMRTFASTRNILKFMRELFESSQWQGVYIVEDISEITGFEAAKKARDVNAVKVALNNLADYIYKEKALIYNSQFTKDNLTVVVRTLSNGFNVNFPYIVSGEVQVFNIVQQFDINIAAAS